MLAAIRGLMLTRLSDVFISVLSIRGSRLIQEEGNVMPRIAIGAAFVFIVSVLPGCMGGAKLVHSDMNGGVVSIPENSNVWPFYYRDAAYAKIRENYPAFDPGDIVEQGEVVIGKQTQNNARTDSRQIGRDGKPIGEVVTKSDTSTTTDLKEFYITYKVKPKTMAVNPSNNGLQQAGGIPKYGNGAVNSGSNTGLPPRSSMNGQPALDPVPNSSTTFGTR